MDSLATQKRLFFDVLISTSDLIRCVGVVFVFVVISALDLIKCVGVVFVCLFFAVFACAFVTEKFIVNFC